MIKELLHAYGTRRRREFAHDRLSTLGSSAAGQCIRKTLFGIQSAPQDEGFEDSWGGALRGTVYEDHCWVPALRAALPEGCELMFAGTDQVTMVDEEARLSATPDGLIVGLGRDCLREFEIADTLVHCIGLECKTMEAFGFGALRRPRHNHEFQVQQALGLFRRCTDFAPEYAIISYTNASFWEQVKEYVIHYDERVYQAAALRAKELFATSSPLDLAPEGKLAGGDECKYCGWFKQCGEGEVSRVPAGGVRLDADAVMELKSLRDAERKLAGAIDDNSVMRGIAQEAIKRFLHDHDVRSHKGDGWSVTWSTVKGRVTRDFDAIAEAGIDLSPYEKEGNASERLIVT